MGYKYSIIIPVLNEQSIINETISHINTLNLFYDVEIIVVDGSSSGKTINSIENKNVTKAISQKGRGNQLNKGASVARGEILIFLHADTRIPHDSLVDIVEIMKSNKFVGGAFDLKIDSDRTIYKFIAWFASLRSRVTRIPYGDQVIFMRKDYFNAIGGFRNIPIMEDVEIMRRIKKNKDKIYIIQKKVLTSPRRWEKDGILCCTFRNWILITLYILGVKPDRLAKFYR